MSIVNKFDPTIKKYQTKKQKTSSITLWQNVMEPKGMLYKVIQISVKDGVNTINTETKR